MNRYCPDCQKEFDFPITSVEDLDKLSCPVCGRRIDKDSRKPVDDSGSERTEAAIGNAISTLSTISFFFYVTLALVGAASYFLGWSAVLRVMTGICLAVFLIQQLSGFCVFKTGILFIPLGAAAGAFLLKSLDGACLGVCAVFIIRHALWDLAFMLFGKILSAISKS